MRLIRVDRLTVGGTTATGKAQRQPIRSMKSVLGLTMAVESPISGKSYAGEMTATDKVLRQPASPFRDTDEVKTKDTSSKSFEAALLKFLDLFDLRFDFR